MKKTIFTICLIATLIAVSFMAGFSVIRSQAVVPVGFGGRLVSVVPCTCSPSFWIYYAPLWAPSPLLLGGALGYDAYATITYPYYQVATPGVWHLGTYLPGVQSCWIWVAWTCVPLPVLGKEVTVGTSAVPAVN